MCKRALAFSVLLMSVRSALVCVVSMPVLEHCRLPKASPPCGCLPAGGRLSCPFEVPDGSFLSVDHCVLPHPLLGPCALQDPLARISQKGKHAVFTGASTESCEFCQDSKPVHKDLQPWDFCQWVLEPVGQCWLDPSSTSRQVWLVNSPPGAMVLDVAVCPARNNSLVLSSVCRETLEVKTELELLVGKA